MLDRWSDIEDVREAVCMHGALDVKIRRGMKIWFWRDRRVGKMEGRSETCIRFGVLMLRIEAFL